MLPPDLQPHFDAIARAYGLEDETHQPGPRGVLQLVEDLETTVQQCSERGRRFSLLVVRSSDIEAIIGLRKIVNWAKKQHSGK